MLAMIKEIRVRVIREAKKVRDVKTRDARIKNAPRETRAVLSPAKVILKGPATSQEARERRIQDNPAVTRAVRVDNRINKNREKVRM
jgi:hypothetical protein